MSVADTLRNAARALEGVSPSPRLDAELLMADALGTGRSEMLLRHGRDDVPEVFAPLLEKRMAGQPVAQIIGHQEFYGLSFKVTPAVLIPRPDTETLIDAAQQAFGDRAPTRILDCGTGTGALLLAALSIWPESTGIGIERSPAALAVAQENAAELGMADRAAMQPGDWTAPGWTDDLGPFDLILSNPPYVETDDPDLAPDVRAYEPPEALFAGADGLDDYRQLVPAFPDLLAKDGIVIIEIGSRQADTVSAIARATGLSVELKHDLANNPRALLLRDIAE
ncbi:peptide chain release factor N(5)-glutamine methyltransferase [Croceicoccus naphthovorans]|uniref:Release factor glutamine methyltransferase n=1 Tax=Croceicoccus naphthovorans TaxID=1348774 RepID=A0A0G3XII0_9SPHN|nr:peptide chain release factor N(5)-glutamine methyltransferase [Croceicoccus naphthovorans]AKM11390.1 SAM-dependent methyltransferase [Croceicoccus naphthovorans]MBB3992109.1 release factor glutamine methyltransferase [Croceicoccus naphthovorans]